MEIVVKSERPVALSEIVEHSGLPGPTAFRILSMLESAGLMQRDGVEIPFHDNQRIGPTHGLARTLQAIQRAALVEERCLRRVQVFRLALAQYTPAEPDHPLAEIEDREHDAGPEAVVIASRILRFPTGLLFRHDHPGQEHVRRRVPLLGEMSQKAVPRLRRESKAEGIKSLARHPSLAEIGHRPIARLGIEQVPPKPSGYHVVQLLQTFTIAGVLSLPRTLHHGHFNAGPAAQLPHRFRKGRPFHLHHEGKGVAALAAAETVEDLPGGTDHEGGGFFAMEGTEPFEILAGLGEGHVTGNHIQDVRPFFDLFNDILRDEAEAHAGTLL